MTRLHGAAAASSSEERLRSIIASSADGVLVVDEEGLVELVNPAGERLFGRRADEVVGRSVADLFSPGDGRRVLDELRRHLDHGESALVGAAAELEARGRDGSSFLVRLSVGEARLGERRLFTVVAHDLTAHARALDELRVGRERLELALAAGEMGAWEWEVASGRVRWSETLERLHGLKPGTFAGSFEAFREHVHEDDRERVLAAVDAALDGDEPYSVEYRIRRPDGELRWLSARGTVVRDSSSSAVRMLGVCEDVTERKLDEQRFRQRFAQFGAIYRMTEAIGRAYALEEIYELALDGLAEALSIDRAAVLLADPDGVMRFKAWRGVSDAYRAAVEGHSPWAPDDPRPAPVLVGDVDREESLAPLLETLRSENIRSLAFMPLVSHGRLIGKLVLYFERPHAMREDGVRLSQAIASTIAVAIDRRRDEEERARLLEQERLAREAAERATARVQRLHSLTTALADAATVDEIAGVLVREGVAAIGASAGAVFLADAGGEALVLTAQRGYGDAFVERLGLLPVSARAGAPRAFRRRRPLWYGSAGDYAAAHAELADFYATLGYQATAFLPLLAGQETLGVFAVSFVEQRLFQLDEREHLIALAGQCAQALERARLFEREHAIAETLQHSILPRTVPAVEGLAIATSYLPGIGHGQVGGDWYDVIQLETPGRVTFVVGDVEGKGVEAAASMAQLRFAMQGFASQALSPAVTLNHLNRLLDRTGMATFATVVAVEVDPRTGVLRYANAGHPPPLVVDREGKTAFLEETSSLPLGVDPHTAYEEAASCVEHGSALVLYTDGLVERRAIDMTARLERLREAAGLPDGAASIRDRILAELVDPEQREDDIALVVAVRQ